MRPRGKAVQSAGLLHDVASRPEIQMIGIPENDPGTDLFEFPGLDSLNSSLCPHRHEYGGGNSTVVGGDASCPRPTVGMLQAEFQSIKL